MTRKFLQSSSWKINISSTMCHHRDDLKMVPGPIIFMSYLCYCSDCYASESPSSSAPPSLKGELIRKFLLNLSHLITIFCLPQCVSVKKSSSSQPMPKILLLLLCQSCPIFRVKFNNIKLHLWTHRGVWRTAKCRSKLREQLPPTVVIMKAPHLVHLP